MSWLTSLEDIVQPIVSGLPKKPKIPGYEADDPSVFASDAGGYTGQGPLYDPSASSRLASDTPDIPASSSLPPSVGMPRESTPPEPTSQSEVPSASGPVAEPASSTPASLPNFAAEATPAPANLPPLPQMAPPQPTALAGNDVSSLPQPPALQSATALPPLPGSQPSVQLPPPQQRPIVPQGVGEPSGPGSNAQPVGQQALPGGLIPRSQAQFNAGMGQIPGGQLPPRPGQAPPQGSLSSPVLNQISQNVNAPRPLPPRPPAWRQALAIGAGMAGGPGFAPLIAYGAKGIQQRQQQAVNQQQITDQLKLAPVISEDLNRQNEAANRQVTATEAQRQHNEQAYTTQANNIRGQHGYELYAGQTVPDGYTTTTLSNPQGASEAWAIPTHAQIKKEEEEAKHAGDVPLGDEITKVLGLPKGLSVPDTVLPHIVDAYRKRIEDQNPNLEVQKSENKVTGDVTLISIDKKTGKVINTEVVKGAAMERPPSDIGSLNALDREVTRFAKPHEKYVADADAQLAKINDTLGLLSNANITGDALGIPKLLTALVSGQGTGVRITQAELQQIAGARGVAGDVQAFFQKISGTGKLTPEQRTQYTQILNDVRARVMQKQAIANHALDVINSAPNRDAAIQADRDARAKITEFEQAQGGTASGGHPAVGQSFNGAKITSVKELPAK